MSFRALSWTIGPTWCRFFLKYQTKVCPLRVGKFTNETVTVLDTDASAFCIRGVLSQIKDGQEQVIAYFSKSLKTRTQLLCHSHRAPCCGWEHKAFISLSLWKEIYNQDRSWCPLLVDEFQKSWRSDGSLDGSSFSLWFYNSVSLWKISWQCRWSVQTSMWRVPILWEKEEREIESTQQRECYNKMCIVSTRSSNIQFRISWSI